MARSGAVPDHHMSAAEQFFKEADTENTGYLTYSEMSALLHKKGYAGSEQQVKDMFNSIDCKVDGKVSLSEFLQAMGEQPPSQHKQAHMRRVFRAFDKSGDGRIDKSELDAVFKELHMSVSPEEIQKMIDMADKDHQGSLDYNEFMELVFGKQN